MFTVSVHCRAIMKDVKRDNRVLSLVNKAGLRNQLTTMLDQLQRCQKSLNEFLEVSRSGVYFPRILFCSFLRSRSIAKSRRYVHAYHISMQYVFGYNTNVLLKRILFTLRVFKYTVIYHALGYQFLFILTAYYIFVNGLPQIELYY